MTFERTTDMQAVRKAVLSVWDQVTDDLSPAPEEWAPTEHPCFWYIAVHDGDEFLGIFLFEQRGAYFSVHTCLLPTCGPFRAVRAARGAAEWIWKNTPARRIITEVPAFNRGAYKLARLAGMEQFGRNPAAYIKRQSLHDLILMGISAPEV